MKNPFKKSMNFAEAVSFLDKETKVSRENEVWKSKGLYLKSEDDAVCIFNSNGDKSVYTPSEEDTMAKDWITL